MQNKKRESEFKFPLPQAHIDFILETTVFGWKNIPSIPTLPGIYHWLNCLHRILIHDFLQSDKRSLVSISPAPADRKW